MAIGLHVLYIDDDPLMLKATARMIRRIQPEWSITTVSDSVHWAENLACEPLLIISDLLMPQIRGDSLLIDAKQRFPLALRCLVTGNTNQDATSALHDYSHFVLPKPFSEGDLASVLAAAYRLNSPPFSPECLNKLNKISAYIPVMPKVVKDVQTLMQSEDGDLKKLAEIIKQEPSLTARVIQLANSAYFGFSSSTLFLEVAISRLGSRMIEAITLCMLNTDHSGHLTDEQHQMIVNEYLEASQKAKSLTHALHLSREEQEMAFMMTLMVSIGALTIAQSGCDTDHNPLESRHLDGSLNDILLITAYVLTLWGYSEEITRKILTISFSLTNLKEDRITNCVSIAFFIQFVMNKDGVTPEQLLARVPSEYKSAITNVLQLSSQ
ncbi:HDOD domain-containing protein [Vibrio zhugei]|uniref:HDOD domain-containing protein n=1 Tax=Vibrio zhugei TaxID=2479546 RepID=A0ABV7C631_9VIBR|nr:HDOD domain-containing protein [Vibrio zhugei]